MNFNSPFLNGYITKEFYVYQPPSFENQRNPETSSQSMYERLNSFLLKNDFTRGKVDTNLFCKSFKNDILIVQIYVDDIIYGSANATLYKDFFKSMQAEFEMILMGELKFFLGIQFNQSSKVTYIHRSKYTRELLKKFNLSDCKQQRLQCIQCEFWRKKKANR